MKLNKWNRAALAAAVVISIGFEANVYGAVFKANSVAGIIRRSGGYIKPVNVVVTNSNSNTQRDKSLNIEEGNNRVITTDQGVELSTTTEGGIDETQVTSTSGVDINRGRKDIKSSGPNLIKLMLKYPFLRSMTVLNAGERNAVAVKQRPSNSSKTLGYIYGKLAEVKVLSKVPGGYTLIQGRDYTSLSMMRGYVKSSAIKEVKINSQYSILIKKGSQRVYVGKNGYLEKEIICSTGAPGKTETPVGNYVTGSKVDYVIGYGEKVPFGIRFNKGFYVHATPSWRAGKLGTRVTHGCVAVSQADAKWLWDNIPQGTPLVIIE